MQRHDNQLGRQTVTFPSRTKDTNVGMIRINRQQKKKTKDWQRCEKAIIEIASHLSLGTALAPLAFLPAFEETCAVASDAFGAARRLAG